MKTKNKLIFSLMAMLSMAFMISCSSDDSSDPQGADKTELNATIVVGQNLMDNTEEGTSDGQYLIGSKAELEVAMAAAQAVANDPDATQAQVINANANLAAAITVYQSKLITPIAPENLMAHWKFDEGSGVTAADATDNGLNGTLTTGHSFWGAGNPEWATDRYGNEKSALYLDKGAHVEVPYNTKLNPGIITVSLWMKQDVNDPILNNQYMVAMNRWNCYKFNMQDSPKPFFTVNPQQSPGSYINEDSADPVLTQGSWYHIAVTFGNGHMTFYVNGVLTKDWLHDGTILDISGSPIDLAIGQDLPNASYSDQEGDFYVNWGGYFKGLLDEVRIYNTVLTETQVQSLYSIEKP